MAALGLVLALGAGCATSNYDFDALPEADGDARAARLWSDLTDEQEGGDHDELYDIDVFPLVHSHLNVFAESDDEELPEGYVEADIDAYLPLFGFVDATIQRYDTQHRVYERHDVNSYLWGLFVSHREQLATPVGLREEKVRRFLWLFDWRSSPTYRAL